MFFLGTEDDARKATEERTSIPQRPDRDSSESCSSDEVDDPLFKVSAVSCHRSRKCHISTDVLLRGVTITESQL